MSIQPVSYTCFHLPSEAYRPPRYLWTQLKNGEIQNQGNYLYLVQTGKVSGKMDKNWYFYEVESRIKIIFFTPEEDNLHSLKLYCIHTEFCKSMIFLKYQLIITTCDHVTFCKLCIKRDCWIALCYKYQSLQLSFPPTARENYILLQTRLEQKKNNSLFKYFFWRGQFSCQEFTPIRMTLKNFKLEYFISMYRLSAPQKKENFIKHYFTMCQTHSHIHVTNPMRKNMNQMLGMTEPIIANN